MVVVSGRNKQWTVMSSGSVVLPKDFNDVILPLEGQTIRLHFDFPGGEPTVTHADGGKGELIFNFHNFTNSLGTSYQVTIGPADHAIETLFRVYGSGEVGPQLLSITYTFMKNY